MRSGLDSPRCLVRAGAGSLLAGLVVSLMACAAEPTASTYAKFNCTELAGEADRAQQTLVYYAGWQPGVRPGGQVMQSSGFLLWPAFAFLEEERGRDSRFDELRSRYLAIADASAEKACPVSRPPAINQAGVPVRTVSGDRG